MGFVWEFQVYNKPVYLKTCNFLLSCGFIFLYFFVWSCAVLYLWHTFSSGILRWFPTGCCLWFPVNSPICACLFCKGGNFFACYDVFYVILHTLVTRDQWCLLYSHYGGSHFEIVASPTTVFVFLWYRGTFTGGQKDTRSFLTILPNQSVWSFKVDLLCLGKQGRTEFEPISAFTFQWPRSRQNWETNKHK